MKLDIDKQLIIKRFGASFESYDRLADVQRRICERLASLIDGEPRRVLEIGAGTGFLTRLLVEKYELLRRAQDDAAVDSSTRYARFGMTKKGLGVEWFVNDLSPASEGFVRAIFEEAASRRRRTNEHRESPHGGKLHPTHTPPRFLIGDAEAVEFPQNLDLIASTSTMQWFEDAAAFLAKAAAALAPGGVLAVSTFGPENFRELRPAGLDYLSINELTALMERAGLVVEHTEEWTETLSFDEPLLLLRYVKALGLNALPVKTSIKTFNETRLTYHPMIIIGRKR